jgi:hypothetical protein
LFKTLYGGSEYLAMEIGNKARAYFGNRWMFAENEITSAGYPMLAGRITQTSLATDRVKPA